MKYLFYILVVINLVFFTWKFGLQHSESFLRDENDQHLELPDHSAVPPDNGETGDNPDSYPAETDPAESITGPIIIEPPSLPRTASAKGCPFCRTHASSAPRP